MSTKNYRRTRFACYYAYLAMSTIFVLPPMLFIPFHEMYGISYTLLGTLVLINFCTQLSIDLAFTFFSKYFNIRLLTRIMPLLTSAGLTVYALVPTLLPQYAYAGLVTGTVIFSVAAGLSEVQLSPVVASLPSEHPEKDMSILHSLYGWGVVSVVMISSLFFLAFGTENWMILTLILAILPLIASALFWISPMPEMKSAEGAKGSGNRSIGLLLCVLCIFLGSAAENTMTNWISGFMESALNLPKAAGDILGLAVFALLLAITRVLYARFTPDISKTLLWSMVGSAACYVVAGLCGGVILPFLACILLGMFSSMLWPGTLILMEERVPLPGVAAYALMAAGGDLGASAAPQLLGILVDKIAVSQYAITRSASTGASPEEIGLKIAMLLAAVFPILGTAVVVIIRRKLKKVE